MNDNTPSLDDLFRRAVSAIDAGDVLKLKELIDEFPEVLSIRLESPGSWLSEQVGIALEGFFSRPYLLWFVAEDPVRKGRHPDNIVEVLRVLIDAARQKGVASIQEQLDYTLRLVSWSGVSARSGHQLDLIDILVEAGATPARYADDALVNGHITAAEHLIARGGELTLATALCLGKWVDASRLLAGADKEQRQFAFVLAALKGRADAVAWLVKAGIPIDQPSATLYAHGTPLHHAVCSGSLDTVQILVDAGADLSRCDSVYHGTPLGWAEYNLESATGEAREGYSAIVTYLRSRAVPSL